MLRNFLKNEEGSAVVLIAVALTMLLGSLALVTDVGLLYLTDHKLANAVDAAALAGAQELPYHPLTAKEKAKEYGELNGLVQDDLTVEITDSNRSIKVFAQKNVTFLFAKVLGKNSGQVNHTAVAIVAPIIGVNGAAPLGIEKHDFEFGTQYTLKVGAGDTDSLSDEISPGWFGALALGGPGASQYEENLTYGYEGALKVGDIIDIQTGNISGPTKKAIDYRIAEDKHVPYCTVDNFHRDCSRLLKVPVIEAVDKKNVKIIGFSMFLVDDVTGQGNKSYVKGKFVKTITSGEVDASAGDYGLMGVRLVQ